jgi:hypothetical protein
MSFRNVCCPPTPSDLSVRALRGRYLSGKSRKRRHSLALLEKLTVHASLLEKRQLRRAHKPRDEVGPLHVRLIWACRLGKDEARIEAIPKHTVTTLHRLCYQRNRVAQREK